MKIKKSMASMPMFVCLMSSATAQYFTPIPVPGPDASDLAVRQSSWMNSGARNAAYSSGSERDGTLNGAAAFRLSKEFYDAIEEEEWEDALEKLVRYYNATLSSFIETDLNRADYLLMGSMLAWNCGQKEPAKNLAERAVDKMRQGEHLGGGCHVRAERFLSKMREGDLPRYFGKKDIAGGGGVRGYIMELPNAKFEQNLAALNARYEAIGGRADAWKGVYEAEGRFREKRAKLYANREYQEKTHRRFDPDDPPARGSSDREYWDAAKRIYDIFQD